MKTKLWAILFLLCPLPVAAQLTTVTGTVSDINGIPYTGGLIKMQLVTTAGSPLSGQPTVTVNNQAQCVSGGFGSAPCQVPFQGTVGQFQLPTGSFTVNLQDNTLITPAATQWLFTATTTGSPPPVGTGPQSCTSQITISGPTQTVALSCPKLTVTSPGISAGVVTSGLLAQYQMLPTETCGGLIDYSGNGRNAVGTVGVAPTIIAGTGGCNFTGNGAVILPSSLNSAKTMQVFASFNEPQGAASLQALVGGNGGGASNNECGFGFFLRGMDAGNFTSYGNQSSTLSQSATNPNGTALFTYMLDTNDRLFVNATETGYLNVSPCSGVVPAGSFQLGGAAAGSGFNSVTYLTGVEYYALFYNRVLTPQEIALNNQTVTSLMTQRGVPATLTRPVGGSFPYIVFQGDSITAGNGTNPIWTAILQNFTGSPNNLSGVLTNNIAIVGRAFGPPNGIDTNAGLEIDSMLHFAGRLVEADVVFIWAGTNNACGNAANCQGVVDAMSRTCRNQLSPTLNNIFFKCGVVTMISRAGQDSQKDIMNPQIRAQVPTWGACCFLVDVAADQRLGADGANANLTYFQADNVHPNQNSAYNIIAPLMSRATNRALTYQAAGTGAISTNDFSSANVYTSAAPAATATTAGSESGNTVTLTFAANTFLNGQVMTCAGITPAAYNGTWTLNTNTATQVTYFNPTTGLGAITVQGTCSVPQQVDQDRYIVLNFGAGTFNLQSCIGYTGQNLYIKNINAAASTVAAAFPGGSANRTAELIDGAASVSVASNATLILQAVLTSNTAGGCNWIRLQNN